MKKILNWPTGTLAALGTTLVIFIGLYGVLPYANTYADPRPVPLFSLLWQFWNKMPDWEHGMMVPFICAGLVYWHRDSLRGLRVEGSNQGAGFLLFSFFCFWLGSRGDLKPVAFLSVQLMAGSFIIWYLGWNWFRALLFPWGFLVFAWPFPFLESMVAFPLRIVMAEFSYIFLNIIGISCLKVGSAIVSAPDYTLGLPQGHRFALDVANPCSGIRSLFALCMITALYGHITMPRAWQKWVLFASAVPLAILGNFVRILMLTFGTILFGSSFAIGTLEKPTVYHMVSGFMVFAAALAGMLAVAWALQLNWPKLIAQWKELAKKRVDEKPAPAAPKKMQGPTTNY